MEKEIKLQLPSISVVIVSYNQADSLSKCIKSIGKQTYSPFELIVVDDFSCDWNESELRRISEACLPDRKKLFYQLEKHSGPSVAYQCALEKASGDYIIFLGGDDWLAYEHVLEDIGKFILARTDEPAVVQGCAKIDEQPCSRLPSPGADDIFNSDSNRVLYEAALGRTSLFSIHSAVFKRDVLHSIGGFNKKYEYAFEDALYYYLIAAGVHVVPYDNIITVEQNNGAFSNHEIQAVYLKDGLERDRAELIQTVVIPILKKTGLTEQARECKKKAESLKIDSEIKNWWFTLDHTERVQWKKEHHLLDQNPYERIFCFPLRRAVFSCCWVFFACIAFEIVFPKGIIISFNEIKTVIYVDLVICLVCFLCSVVQVLLKRQMKYSKCMSMPFFLLVFLLLVLEHTPILFTVKYLGLVFWILIIITVIESIRKMVVMHNIKKRDVL